MKIVYVAKHDSGGNDDEGAITHALTVLGHRVEVLREVRGHNAHRLDGDFLLFHKWDRAADFLPRLKIPKVFWYFDMVGDGGDPTLAKRSAARVAWMQRVLPLVELGFCTDGDWVRYAEQWYGVKLRQLTQGFDERMLPHAIVGEGDEGRVNDVLFVGGRGGGRVRESFVQELEARYGQRFKHVPHGCYGPDLAKLIRASKVVVAPDGPTGEWYCSNRVYNMLGFGAFLVHPERRILEQQYDDRQDWEEILLYEDRREMFDMIDLYLKCLEERRRISRAGHERTVAEHTYKHRCAELVATVQKKLGVLNA